MWYYMTSYTVISKEICLEPTGREKGRFLLPQPYFGNKEISGTKPWLTQEIWQKLVFFPTERGFKSVRHELNPPVLLIVRYCRNTRGVVVPSCRKVGRNGTAGTVGPVTPQEWCCPSRGLSCRELGGHKSYRQGLFIHIGFFSHLQPSTCGLALTDIFIFTLGQHVHLCAGKNLAHSQHWSSHWHRKKPKRWPCRRKKSSICFGPQSRLSHYYSDSDFLFVPQRGTLWHNSNKNTEEKTFSNARIEKEQ